MKHHAASSRSFGDCLLQVDGGVSDRVGSHPAENIRGQHAKGGAICGGLTKRARAIAEDDPILILLDDGEGPASAVLQVDQDRDQLIAAQMLDAQRCLVLSLYTGSQARSDAADVCARIFGSGDGFQVFIRRGPPCVSAFWRPAFPRS